MYYTINMMTINHLLLVPVPYRGYSVLTNKHYGYHRLDLGIRVLFHKRTLRTGVSAVADGMTVPYRYY
jgi:hypothetical protein